MPVAPFWLLLLVPWAALGVWMWVGFRKRTPVPHLPLWPIEAMPARASRHWHRPPWAILLLLAAALFSILAMARFELTSPTPKPRLTVILDRGLLASGGPGGRDRAAEALAALELPPWTQLDVVAVPGSRWQTTASDRTVPAPAPPTLIDTTAAVRAAARRALDDGAAPVVVIAAVPTGLSDDRLHEVPLRPLNNVGIERLAAVAMPRPLAMVRVRNDGDRRATTLTLESAGQRAERTVDLPPRGSAVDVFVDLPAVDETLKATLAPGNDDVAADDLAYAVRSSSWPRLATSGTLPAEVLRAADAYRSARAADDDAKAVTFTDSPDPRGPSLVFARPARAAPADGAWAVADHPITRRVPFTTTPVRAVAALPAGAGWRAVVSRGDVVYIAVRDQPARQVWVGVDLDAWSLTPSFPLFVAQAIDWTVDAADAGGLDAVPVADRPDAKAPAILTDDAGRRVAVNVPAPTGSGAAMQRDGWDAARLSAQLAKAPGATVDLTPAFAGAAAALVLAASLVAARRAADPAQPVRR
jgi:hypothetical protein